MKYLIFITFLLCPFIVYGQDLIVATSGDSLKCKIVEVKSDEIQFRFGTGGVISIPRNEVRSYQYNFTPAAPANRNAPAKNADPVYSTPANVPSKTTEKDFSRFYTGILAGYAADYGTLIGLNGAVFFNHLVGVGLALRYQYDLDSYSNYSYEQLFLGPVFYGHWGRRNGKLFFPTYFGFGLASSSSYSYSSDVELGVFTSVGIAFRPVKFLSFGVNLEGALGIDYVEMLAISTGISFHF